MAKQNCLRHCGLKHQQFKKSLPKIVLFVWLLKAIFNLPVEVVPGWLKRGGTAKGGGGNTTQKRGMQKTGAHT